MPHKPLQAEAGPAESVLGSNPGRNRVYNRRIVLNLLRRHGTLGRKELADMAQLSTQAVANIIEDLRSENLLLDRGRRRSGRGQPPLQFSINPEGALTIGMELSVSDLTVTALDLGGQLRRDSRIPIGDVPVTALVDMMAQRVEAVRQVETLPLLGVGLVMPGPFGVEGLSGVGPHNLPGWSAGAAGAALARKLGLPVLVENDANAAAVGEGLFGAARPLRDFCLIYFGTGVGLGVVANGQPLRGAFGNAGEIGHIVVVPGGKPCICGQAGCIERYASPHALKEELAAAGLPQDEEAIASLHEARDPVLLRWIEEAAKRLSTMITMLENILDPQAIILGGRLPDPVIDAMIAGLRLGPSVSGRRDRAFPRVLRGQTGRLTAALGAASLPYFDAITPRFDPVAPNDQSLIEEERQ